MQYVDKSFASGKCGDNLTWAYDDKQRILDIDGSGSMQFAAMPWEAWKDEIEVICLHECSSICAGAFRDFKNLREVVVLEEELKEIGPSAFEDCVSLKTFDLSCEVELQKVSDSAFRNCICMKNWDADVSVVGNRAFENCTNLNFGNHLVGTEKIGEYAFANCKQLTKLPMYDMRQGWFCHGLSEFEVGYELPLIPTGAFLGCEGLKSISIPCTVKKIDCGAFAQCPNLTDILITRKTEYDPTEFLQEPMVVDGFGYCDTNKSGSNEIRWAQKDGILHFSGNGVVVADPHCDSWQDPCCPPWEHYIHTVIIDDGCTAIQHNTFSNERNLKNVIIPSSVSFIGHYAFAWCVNMETLLIPDTVERIDPNAFKGIPHIIYHGPAQSDDNWGALSRN